MADDARPPKPLPETATVPEGYDPDREEAVITDLQERLQAAGIACEGQPVSAPPSGAEEYGSVVGLQCIADGEAIYLNAFRTTEDAAAALDKLSTLNCRVNERPTYYVAHDAWAVTVGEADTGLTSEASTSPVADALGRPVERTDC